MLLDYMVSCIICILVPSLCLSFSWCTGKKKPYLKWDVSNLYFPCFIRRRKQICFVGAAAPAQWQINSYSFDITVHVIISSTNGRGLTLCVLARATWQRGGMSLLPAEMLQEVSVERGWGFGWGTGPPFPARGSGWHGYKPPALGFPQPCGTGTGVTRPLCTPCAQDGAGRDGWTRGRHSRNVPGAAHMWGITNALGLWTSFPWTPSLAAPCLLLSHKLGTKAHPGLGPPWAHWKAQNKVCKPHLKQKLQ